MADRRRSVLHMLQGTQHAKELRSLPAQPSHTSVIARRGSVEDYVGSVMADIDAGRRDVAYQPIVAAANALQVAVALQRDLRDNSASELTDADVLAVVSRPDLFVWVPELVIPGLRIDCMFCKATITCKEWAAPRILHGLTSQMVYVTMKYRCRNCIADPIKGLMQDSKQQPDRPAKRIERKFQADEEAFLNALPAHVKGSWNFVNTGKIICEASVVDFIRALATRASWSAIADAINELKTEAWHRNVRNWRTICELLGIRTRMDAPCMPDEWRLSAQWVRNAYVTDASHRQVEVCRELAAQCGDQVLVLDWTIDAAARCNSKFLFNAMDGQRKILLSALTETCNPREADPFLATLAERGVHPLVVYVDCECCGAWPRIVQRLWKDAVVRLDGMHAIRRLTRTVSSTQHPWHDRFCAAVSNAIYTYDADVLERLRIARQRSGRSAQVPASVRAKFVARQIKHPGQIAASIESVIAAHSEPHVSAGPLLTDRTLTAWRDLRTHVLSGCLCDPDNVVMNVLGDSVTIGGESFNIVKSRRGASALEGFHTHQKQWLGSLATHAADAGAALLADGAVRWNRKRQREE